MLELTDLIRPNLASLIGQFQRRVKSTLEFCFEDRAQGTVNIWGRGTILKKFISISRLISYFLSYHRRRRRRRLSVLQNKTRSLRFFSSGRHRVWRQLPLRCVDSIWFRFKFKLNFLLSSWKDPLQTLFMEFRWPLDEPIGWTVPKNDSSQKMVVQRMTDVETWGGIFLPLINKLFFE